MKKIGLLFLITGILGLFTSLTLDTSVVTSGFGSTKRIHNIGLMNEKQNALLFFSAISILGAIFFGISSSRSSQGETPSISPEVDAPLNRTCPYCAESIKAKAILCRYCGRDIEPIPVVSAPPPTPIPDPPKLQNSIVDLSHTKLEPMNEVTPTRQSKAKPIGRPIDLEKKWETFIAIISLGLIRKE